MDLIKPFQFSQQIHGVQVKPLVESGKEVRILYNGPLSSSGAENVELHYGFGYSGNWDNVHDLGMERSQEGWEVSVSMIENQLNFCFRDSAFKWDNNNGLNWIYRIS